VTSGGVVYEGRPAVVEPRRRARCECDVAPAAGRAATHDGLASPNSSAGLSGFQAEGIVAAACAGDPLAPGSRPTPKAKSRRCVERVGDRLVDSADRRAEELAVEGELTEALCAVGDRLSPYPVVSVPPGWCSWSAYFSHATEADVLENAEAALYSRSR